MFKYPAGFLSHVFFVSLPLCPVSICQTFLGYISWRPKTNDPVVNFWKKDKAAERICYPEIRQVGHRISVRDNRRNLFTRLREGIKWQVHLKWQHVCKSMPVFFLNFRNMKWLVKYPLLMFFLQKAGWFKWGWQGAEEDYQTSAKLLKEPTERQSFIWALQSGNQTASGSSACPVPLCATMCNSWGILVATSFPS